MNMDRDAKTYFSRFKVVNTKDFNYLLKKMVHDKYTYRLEAIRYNYALKGFYEVRSHYLKHNSLNNLEFTFNVKVFMDFYIKNQNLHKNFHESLRYYNLNYLG